MSTGDEAIERLRKRFVREVRLHRLGAHEDDDEATSILADAAVFAVLGEPPERKNALSCHQVVEEMRVLPPALRTTFRNRLCETDEVRWRDRRFACPGGGPPGRYTPEFIRAAMTLRQYLLEKDSGDD